MKYKKLSFKQNAIKQYKIFCLKQTSNNIFVKNLYILNNETYLYEVSNKNQDEWYIINENELAKLNIIKKETIIGMTKICFLINNNKGFYLIIHDNQSIELFKNNVKTIYKTYIDYYLYNMFYNLIK